MDGLVKAIWRHPVKGFTPEPLGRVELAAGACFPFDRLYAVEDGPSGFDAAAPRHISKQKFTVLAKIAEVARIRTRYDEASGVLAAEAPGAAPIRADLTQPEGREALAAWLTAVLGPQARGPLKVLPAPGAYRFMDDEQGFVSILNLASLDAVSAAAGRPVDPRRFRANFNVEGWPAWIENDAAGRRITLGVAELELIKPIVRCAATHVDPDAGVRDVEVGPLLFNSFGHLLCGVYGRVVRGGEVAVGDAVRLAEPLAPC